MFDPVPFAVGGGAEHSAEVFRTMAFTATGGVEGVAESGDLKVTALPTPGASIRVLPGAALIRSRAVGGAQQTYVARNVTATEVPVSATGSGSGRSDLVAVLIKDPYMAGESWPTPSDPAVGPYVEAVIISNVPAGTTSLQAVTGHANTTGYAVARIDIPASTGTITNAMVKDLRKLASTRTEMRVAQASSTGSGSPWAGGEPGPDPLTSTTFVTWPSVATWQIPVPAWASKAIVVGTVAGAAERKADAWGGIRTVFGSQASAQVDYDFTYLGSPSRSTLTFGGTFAVPANERGTTVTLKFEGKRTGGTGNLAAFSATTSLIQVYFEEGVA